MTPDAALSYGWNEGGLSNQKLALLGLCIAGRDQRRPIALPDLYNLDQSGGERASVPLEAIYARPDLEAFAARHGIMIAPQSEPGSRGAGGWTYFDSAGAHIAGHIARHSMGPDDIACDFFRSLRPLLRDSDAMRRLASAVFEKTSLVIQLRIERDWQFFSAVTLEPTLGKEEDYLPSFSDILAKTAATFGDQHRTAYAACDETALTVPLEEIRDTCRRQFGISLIWKSDLVNPDELSSMSVLDRSIMDFELASHAPVYVGLSRSSFSNLAAFERFATTRQQVTDHYIYNMPGAYLRERHDNGAFAMAAAAVAT